MSATTSASPSVEELEAEREFLLASLRDLERERAADAIDAETFQRLYDDYTARAAATLRAIEATRTVRSAKPDSGRRLRAWFTVVGVVALLVLSGLALWGALRDRASGETMTGKATSVSPDQQLQLLRDDVARNPNSAPAHRALARYFMQEQQYVDALREFDTVAQLDPTDAEARAYGGWITYLAGLTDRALARLQSAVALDPGYPDAYFFRGMVLYRGQNNPTAAIADFEKYLQLAPDSPMAEQVRSVLSSARQSVAATATTVPTNPTTK